jgi:hypothetical protein
MAGLEDMDQMERGNTLSDTIFQKYNFIEIVAPVGSIKKVSHRHTTCERACCAVSDASNLSAICHQSGFQSQIDSRLAADCLPGNHRFASPAVSFSLCIDVSVRRF